MRRALVLAAVVGVQLACVGASVAPQLQARLGGDEYRMRVVPLDPIDPLRGAYVALDHPGLAAAYRATETGDVPAGDAVYLPLTEEDGLWEATSAETTRPARAPYLTCESTGWSVDCGIDSWFASQDRALRLERELAEDGAVATLRIDDRGRAVLVDVR